MAVIRSSTLMIARIFLTVGFLAAGVHKIFHWNESERMLMDVLSHWQFQLTSSDAAQQILSFLIQFTPLVLFIMGALEVVGALLLLLGIREKLGSILLILQLIPTTILFHQFWFASDLQQELHQVLFFKNMAIIGGLLLVLLFGAKTHRRKDDSFRI